MGLILLRENFLLRVRQLIVFQSLFWKLGAIFGASSFHLSNFERIIKSKKGYAHGTHCLKSRIGLYMQVQLGPPILVEQARKMDFNSPTPLLVDYNVTIKKTWVTLCYFLQTHGLGLNPWFHPLYFTNNYTIMSFSRMACNDGVTG